MENITITGASIGLKNFSGRPTPFNDAGGKRTFAVFLNEDEAADYAAQGYPIKRTRPNEESENGDPFMMVTVRFSENGIGPKIVLVNSVGKRLIEEAEVGTLDDYRLKDIDIVIRPYEYDYHGKLGVKAMLKTMYATVEEDEFDKKYADVPFI